MPGRLAEPRRATRGQWPAETPTFSLAGHGLLRRSCACGGSAPCEECGPAPAMKPPPPRERLFVESGLGHDFSRVRVDVGERSVDVDERAATGARGVEPGVAAAARAVGRGAFTVGRHADVSEEGRWSI
jgi:hypothetical protein